MTAAAPAITRVCATHGVVLRTCPCSNRHSARFEACPGSSCPGWGTGRFLAPHRKPGYGVDRAIMDRLRS